MKLKTERILKFIRVKTKEGHYKGGVVGLSGGVDSSLCSVLIAKALGKDRVLGVIMPARDSNPADEKDAKKFAKWLGIKFVIHPITPLLDLFKVYEFYRQFDWEEDIKPWLTQEVEWAPYCKRHFSIMKLRGRMYILTDYARRLDYFQCQTLNKTELMLGWFDKFGDMAGDIALIQHLYKTEVYQLAKYLKLPNYIIERPSGSGLYPQTSDEFESGMTFEEIDTVLKYFEKGGEIKGIETEKIDKVRFLYQSSEVGRNIPLSLLRCIKTKTH